MKAKRAKKKPVGRGPSSDDAVAMRSLHIVAIEGEVDHGATPGRYEPVVVTEAGEPVRVEAVAENGLCRIVTKDWTPDWADGVTALAAPLSARAGVVALVVGRRERAMAAQLARPIRRDDVRVALFASWLKADLPQSDDTLGATTTEGGLFVWLCSPDEAAEVELRIAKVARSELIDAWRQEDRPGLASAAWWLMRASSGVADDLEAAVALEEAGDRPMSDALLHAIALKPTAAQLTEVRERLRRAVDQAQQDLARPRESRVEQIAERHAKPSAAHKPLFPRGRVARNVYQFPPQASA